MGEWVYSLAAWQLAVLMVALFEVVSLGGLFLARRFILPRLRYHDGINDAISGTVQSIGVFYGITIGLIAVGVWNNYASVSATASNEAAIIAALYHDVSTYPEPARTEMQADLVKYVQGIVDEDWPAHSRGTVPITGALHIGAIRNRLVSVEPTTKLQEILYAETLSAFNDLVKARRERISVVGGGLSWPMWGVIWIGAAISIAVGFFFYIEDSRVHAILIGLVAAFLGIVLFVIIVNDRPFAGPLAVAPAAYQALLDTVRQVAK